MCAQAQLDTEGVDAMDFGANTSTRFIPLRSGMKIEGINNWKEWESLRCAAKQQEFVEIQKDPLRYGTLVRCYKTPTFAFQVRGKYPNVRHFTAGESSLFAKDHILLDEKKKTGQSRNVSLDAEKKEDDMEDDDFKPVEDEEIKDEIEKEDEADSKKNSKNELEEDNSTEMKKQLDRTAFGRLLGDIEVYAAFETDKKTFMDNVEIVFHRMLRLLTALDRSFHSSVCGKLLYEPTNFFLHNAEADFSFTIHSDLDFAGTGRRWVVACVRCTTFCLQHIEVFDRGKTCHRLNISC